MSFSELSEVRVTSEEGSEVEGVKYTVASMGKVKSSVPRQSSKVPQLLFRGTSSAVVESRIIWQPISKVPLTFWSGRCQSPTYCICIDAGLVSQLSLGLASHPSISVCCSQGSRAEWVFLLCLLTDLTLEAHICVVVEVVVELLVMADTPQLPSVGGVSTVSMPLCLTANSLPHTSGGGANEGTWGRAVCLTGFSQEHTFFGTGCGLHEHF